MADRCFAFLVRLHFRERLAIGSLIVFHRNLRRHPAHRVDVAAMAGLDQQLCVAPHEMRRHRDKRPIGETEVAAVLKLFDAAEDVVPAACVQTRGMVAQLIENLVHLERGKNRLDQHRRLDGAARNSELVLCHDENVVP